MNYAKGVSMDDMIEKEKAGRIHTLASSVIDQIAAGEIIERPAFALKEILENSLDAGADRIIIKLEESGKKLIEISDNGYGMTEEEMFLAVKRHTTSKIYDLSDLSSLSSFGFRGEALASIASVSLMTVISRIAKEDSGYIIRLDAGKITEGRTEVRSPGTTIRIEQLFFNTPARLKFLKSDRTELSYIMREIEKIVIAFPHIKLQVMHNDKMVLDLHPQESLLSRLLEVWSAEVKDNLFPIDHDVNGKTLCQFNGFLGLPDYTFKDNRKFFLYLNKRPIESRLILAAIKQGLGLESSEYPAGAFFMHLDLNDVDINVHPRKTQVEFYKRDMLFREIVRAIRKEIGRSLQPSLKTRDVSYTQSETFSPFSRTLSRAEVFEDNALFDAEKIEDKIKNNLVQLDLWQLHDSYILTATHGGLLIIDQHNAHERVIYEDIEKKLKSKKITSQRIVFPLMIEVEPEMVARLDELKDLLSEIGFEIKVFGERMIVVDAVPEIDGESFSQESIKEILEDIDPKTRREELRKKVIATVSCKAAIKAGKKMELVEMNNLVDKLFACKEPNFCPHGRPIFIKFPLHELEKLLGRR
ncbi:MAG: DNA mismatch repair endonuclease MutL [Candidatus Coatesbacteria bacterium]|nr:DNA mismatch repair endonuclease MutL [Candidatus Coatesbacteria bacterium]